MSGYRGLAGWLRRLCALRCTALVRALGLQKQCEGLEGRLCYSKAVCGVYSRFADAEFHFAAVVEIRRHDFQQGSGINALDAGLAYRDRKAGVRNCPDEHCSGTGMQPDRRRNHCLLNWQRNSFSRTAPSV